MLETLKSDLKGAFSTLRHRPGSRRRRDPDALARNRRQYRGLHRRRRRSPQATPVSRARETGDALEPLWRQPDRLVSTRLHRPEARQHASRVFRGLDFEARESLARRRSPARRDDTGHVGLLSRDGCRASQRSGGVSRGNLRERRASGHPELRPLAERFRRIRHARAIDTPRRRELSRLRSPAARLRLSGEGRTYSSRSSSLRSSSPTASVATSTSSRWPG